MTEQNVNSQCSIKTGMIFIVFIVLIAIAMFWVCFVRYFNVIKELQSQVTQQQLIIKELQHHSEVQKQEINQDDEKLVLTIDAAWQQINSLSMVPLQTMAAATTTIVTEPLLQVFWASVVKALKDIVIIRRQATGPIPTQEQVVSIRFEIQAKLLLAQLAVMQKQSKIYQACLAQVIDLVTKYFVRNDAAANVLRILQELQQTELFVATQSVKS